MLRLAHRILSQQTRIPSTVDPRGQASYASHYRRCQKVIGLSACQAVIADNVASYYADTMRQEWGLTGKNYPCIAPPFKTTWFIEWDDPGYRVLAGGVIRRDGYFRGQMGALFINMPMEMANVLCQNFGRDPTTLPFEPARWFLFVTTFMTTPQGQVVMAPFRQGVFVDPAGVLLDVAFISDCLDPTAELTQEIVEAADQFLHIPLLTLGFLHCKNVAQLDVTKEEGPTPKWCRRQHVPELKYHALQIDPNLGAKPQAGERKTEGDRSGKALHICRGHFAHFRDDGVSQGLFGRRQFGIFWIPAHTRGSLEHGKIVSTYNVKTPA